MTAVLLIAGKKNSCRKSLSKVRERPEGRVLSSFPLPCKCLSSIKTLQFRTGIPAELVVIWVVRALPLRGRQTPIIAGVSLASHSDNPRGEERGREREVLRANERRDGVKKTYIGDANWVHLEIIGSHRHLQKQ